MQKQDALTHVLAAFAFVLLSAEEYKSGHYLGFCICSAAALVTCCRKFICCPTPIPERMELEEERIELDELGGAVVLEESELSSEENIV